MCCFYASQRGLEPLVRALAGAKITAQARRSGPATVAGPDRVTCLGPTGLARASTISFPASSCWRAPQLLATRAGVPGDRVWMGAGGIAFLTGLWITATHVPLIPDAVDGIAPRGTALLHLSAGPPTGIPRRAAERIYAPGLSANTPQDPSRRLARTTAGRATHAQPSALSRPRKTAQAPKNGLSGPQCR